MRVAIDKEVQVNMSSNSRMTRSMGPAEEVSLPLPARIRKDALTTVGERGNAQTQVDGRVSQQGTAGNSSPFARPGSRAGSSIGAASEVGTPSTPNNPFARPDSHAGSTQRSPSSSSISLLSPSNSVSHGDADTSVCWDLVNPDLDSEVANINNNSPHSHIIATNQPCPNVKEGPSNTNPPGPNNQDCTLYNHDFFIADTTGRRLSQVQDKSRYPQLLPNGNAALQLRLPDLLIYLKTDTFLIDVTTGHHYAMYNNRIEKMSVLPKLYSAWPYRQLMKNLQDDATRFGVSSPEPNTSGAQGLQDQQPVSNPQHTQKEQPSSPCQPTVVRYEPPTFSLKMPSEMLTRAERVRVLQNHVAAVNALFSKIAVLEDLINKEPHNSSHYKEVQRVQRNQHMHVAVKLQQMLEADDQLREAAGLPQLDLPEHLWSVRNMTIAQAREEHFMTITSEIEILCQQTKGKGMYPNLKQNIANNNVHFHPIQPAQTSPLQPEEPVRSYIIRYSRLFKLLNGTAPNEVRMRTTSMHFVNSLRSYLSSKVENRLLGMNHKNYSLGDTFNVALECELKAIATERRHNKRTTVTVHNVEMEDDNINLQEIDEAHVRNPNYKGKNYDPNFQSRKIQNNKQQNLAGYNGSQYKTPYAKPATNNNLSSSSDIAGEVTLKTTVDGYQLLKVNELIKNAAAWRARMPKTSKYDKYFDNKDKPASAPKVQINEATLEVMGQMAKDCGYTKKEFVEAIEMYQHFGDISLEDVPVPSQED